MKLADFEVRRMLEIIIVVIHLNRAQFGPRVIILNFSTKSAVIVLKKLNLTLLISIIVNRMTGLDYSSNNN